MSVPARDRFGPASARPPRVSVVMAAYNAARFLPAAVESILEQSFQDWEFIIIDDGSTDSTPTVLDSYRDPRIWMVRNGANVGQTASLNRGLALARGDFIARQDADDISEPSRLEFQVRFLDDHPEVALLGSRYLRLDEAGTTSSGPDLPLHDDEIRWAMLFYCPFVHAAAMFRRAPVLERVGGYDETLSYSMDFDLWLRISHRFRMANLPQRLVRYREHAGSMTAAREDRTLEGRRIRERLVAGILGWQLPAEEARERYERLLTLVLGGELHGEIEHVRQAIHDLRTVHRHVMEPWSTPSRCERHWDRLRADAAKRLLISAACRLRSEPGTARRLGQLALGVHPVGWLRGIPAAAWALTQRNAGGTSGLG